MGRPGIRLSEIGQTEKDKCCMISHICGFYKIQQTIEYNKKETRLTDIKKKKKNEWLPVRRRRREQAI